MEDEAEQPVMGIKASVKEHWGECCTGENTGYNSLSLLLLLGVFTTDLVVFNLVLLQGHDHHPEPLCHQVAILQH